ncbi:MAG: peptidoglycan DD-metalloendopeptidase family protein [Litorimonas sp.]
MRALPYIFMSALSALAITAFTYTSVYAQTPDPAKLESLTKAEAQARAKDKTLSKQRDSVVKDINVLKKELQRAASQTRNFEREAINLQSRITELTAQKNTLEMRLQADKVQMMELIAALQRLEISPPPSLATTPNDAIKAAQANQLMRGISEQLQSRADNLDLTLTALGASQTELEQKQTALNANQTQLEKRRRETQNNVKRKTDLQKSIDSDREITLAEVNRLAAESQTLRDLIAAFEAEAANIGPRLKPRKDGKPRKAKPRNAQPAKPVTLPKGTVTFAKAKGRMTRPITGPLLRNYGKGEKGLTYTGTSRGQVLAPYAGRVEFSGPFKNYDQVVILNVGDGYFILLTGLGEVFSKAGDNVRLGEPVGTLPYAAKSSPNLYIELRKDGKPLNPTPWLEPRPAKTG